MYRIILCLSFMLFPLLAEGNKKGLQEEKKTQVSQLHYDLKIDGLIAECSVTFHLYNPYEQERTFAARPFTSMRQSGFSLMTRRIWAI